MTHQMGSWINNPLRTPGVIRDSKPKMQLKLVVQYHFWTTPMHCISHFQFSLIYETRDFLTLCSINSHCIFFSQKKKIITKNINFNSFAKKTPHTNKYFHLIFPNNCKLTFGAPSAFLAFPAPSDVLVKQPVKMFNVQQNSLFSFILSTNS